MCNVVTILLYGLMAHRASIFEIDLVDDYYVSSMWGRKMLDLPRFKELAESFYQLNNIETMQQLYISICGANMFLFLLRIFKLLDFQPKVGLPPTRVHSLIIQRHLLLGARLHKRCTRSVC
jgi:hypothetical protein